MAFLIFFSLRALDWVQSDLNVKYPYIGPKQPHSWPALVCVWLSPSMIVTEKTVQDGARDLAPTHRKAKPAQRSNHIFLFSFSHHPKHMSQVEFLWILLSRVEHLACHFVQRGLSQQTNLRRGQRWLFGETFDVWPHARNAALRGVAFNVKLFEQLPMFSNSQVNVSTDSWNEHEIEIIPYAIT